MVRQVNDPFAYISYRSACKKAYKGQVDAPYVIFIRDNGLYGAMLIKTWRVLKIGVPFLFVKHVPPDRMRIGSWEYRDNE